ncbi:hypothetical protein LEP1GSC186_3737 [Leptospira noguchii serovar Autumnalis str. ZUN142]|uniref:Uncharacterized protein n=1 Tax=Leptospira noguchii serovar Autumnalis str. ZUN142 TaxID=1085540 RepID=M6UQZ7_9LEPT|nr:hypothetical protein LEP1GSC186_3737 [Leptospira noguchii serovar Autumnalis str. ZUN142]
MASIGARRTKANTSMDRCLRIGTRSKLFQYNFKTDLFKI